MRILIAESRGFSPAALATLRGAAEVVAADLDRAGLIAAVRDADVLWVRLRNRVDEEVLAAGARLRAIATNTTGLNHIDLAAAERRGIRVLSLRGEEEFLRGVHATAEHAVALALALVRRLPAAAAHARSGGWDRDAFRGRELQGRTAGVVGYGRLGRIVARLLRAFDMRVLAADPRKTPSDLEPGVDLVPLDALLPAADLVTLHVNLSAHTTGFFGRREFTRMKPGAWLVNTARGELLDERALLEALGSGALAGAALDVLSGEDAAGMAAHPLVAWARDHDNLILTPHIGGCTVESGEKTEEFLASRLVEWIRSGPAAARC